MSMVIVYLLLLIPLSLSADIVANDGYGDNINGFDHNFPNVYIWGAWEKNDVSFEGNRSLEGH